MGVIKGERIRVDNGHYRPCGCMVSDFRHAHLRVRAHGGTDIGDASGCSTQVRAEREPLVQRHVFGD